MITTAKYSKNKVTTYRKQLLKILNTTTTTNSKTNFKIKSKLHQKDKSKILRINNNKTFNNNNKKQYNDTLITDIAFEISEIASNTNLVNKYIENKMKYMITNTIRNSINQIKLIPDYEKKDLLNSQIGLKLTPIDIEIIEKYILQQNSIDFYSPNFYEIYLKYNNNNQTRNICVHFCKF